MINQWNNKVIEKLNTVVFHSIVKCETQLINVAKGPCYKLKKKNVELCRLYWT